ncbi:MAG: GAF domain-containing sensor histidine kinase [Gammaproteobacteria bacterium]|nr:GAF domain-containing sensor histidine kinase [Gammaproteobacteria bacterium]
MPNDVSGLSDVADATVDVAAALRMLGDLEYQSGELDDYLARIAESVSRLLGIDWSVVTLSETPGYDRILASSVDIGAAADATYPLHGTVTDQVMRSGEALCVTDAAAAPQHGQVPDGYRAYVGVPLRTSAGRVIGTICSFHSQPKRVAPAQVQIASLFAERAAAAIERFWAFRDLTAFNERLESLVAERTRELRDTQARLIQRERLAAIGEFASMIVHELRSPLSTIDLTLTHLEASSLPDSSRRRVDLAVGESARLARLLDDMLSYAKPTAGAAERVELDRLVADTLASLRSSQPETYAAVALTRAPARLPVRGSADRLRQVLINLVNNACDASPPDVPVTVSIEHDAAQHAARLDVANRNAGAAFDSARAGELFYTTKPRGTGLGLAIVQSSVAGLGGEFSITQDASGRVLARVVIPLAAD